MYYYMLFKAIEDFVLVSERYSSGKDTSPIWRDRAKNRLRAALNTLHGADYTAALEMIGETIGSYQEFV